MVEIESCSEPMSLYGMIVHKSEAFPDRDAVEYYNTRNTYRQMIEKINTCADALIFHGIKQRDHIALCLPNIPEAIFMIYAVNKIGAVCVMMHPLCSMEEAVETVAETNCRAIICLDANLSKFVKTAVHFIITVSSAQLLNPALSFLGSVRLPSLVKGVKVLRWKEFIRKGKHNTENSIHPEDEALILGSGGTCGIPKKIVLTNASINALALMVQSLNRTEGNDGLLCIMPVFHGFGLCFCVHAALLGGKRCILAPRYSDRSFARIMKHSKPAYLVGVPLLYERMVRNRYIKKVDLHYVIGAACGGDSMTERTYNNITEFLKTHGCETELQIGYGLTECVTACTYTPEHEYRPGRVGKPFEGIQIKIVDDINNELPPETVGEILVNGPTLMKEYFCDPEATDTALFKDCNNVLWLKTGDIGKMDKEGYLYFIQRKKRVIKRSGYSVFPSMIEDVVESFPGVSRTCVVNVPRSTQDENNDEASDKLIAFVAIKNAPRNLEAEIIAFCRNRLNPFSVPTRVINVNSLPLTRLKKIDAAALENLAFDLFKESQQ